MKKYNLKLIFLSFLLTLFGVSLFGTRAVNAATLYFSPSSGDYTVGNLLTIGFFVNTEDQAINNSDAVINFPTDLLEVVSVSKSSSIFSLWVKEPSFSNSAGTISFNGGVPTPGYNGTSGKILNIVFRIKEHGSASLVCSSAAVRANDGFGTNVLKTCGLAQFSLVSKTPTPEPAPTPSTELPRAPIVISSTHPDPNKWYNNNNPTFSWQLSNDITGVNVFADRKPTTNPGTRSDGLRNSWTFKDVDDGEWYFHIRLRNRAGWGAITHFKFNIDTQKPEIIDSELVTTDLTDPSPILQIESEDNIGVDVYEVIIDEQDPRRIEITEDREYKLPVLDPGEHTIKVRVLDAAANFKETITKIFIKPLEIPVILTYYKTLTEGEENVVTGISKYPNAEIEAIIKSIPITIKTKTDNDGRFSFKTSKELEPGRYTLSLRVIDDRGAKSYFSEEVTFNVELPKVLGIKELIKNNLALTILILGGFSLMLIIIILLIILLMRYNRLFGVIEKKKKKISLYASKLTILALHKELEHNLKALEDIGKKRKLRIKEHVLRARYKQLKKMIEKYIK